MISLDTNHPVTNTAAELWGENGQVNILQEECAELISAIARRNRGRNGNDEVAEEAADVLVSLMSVIPILGIEEDVIRHMNFKINRLDKRIKSLMEG